MSTKLRGLLVLFGMLLGGILFAQEKTVTGTVTDSNGFPLADVNVSSSSGQEVFTDTDGNYSIRANANDVLTFESLGLEVATAVVGEANAYNVTLREGGTIELEGAVVTALGITRDEKAIGYSAQQVDGDMLTAARVSNPLNALSGNVAGVQITTPSSNLGGSTRITLRGVTSLTQENRPLIVIDGVPMNNSNFNTTTAQRGAGGRDYGDMAYDVNPDDIESINVLKGGPAAALYGSRGANGVIMITTKSAKKGKDEIVFNTGVSIDELSTFPKLQRLYGGGDGDFDHEIINGTEYEVVSFGIDESWGPKFDPNRKVLMWYSFDPEFASDYMVPQPWVAPKSDVEDFFRQGITYTNSISFAKSYENTMARLSLSNVQQSGIVPNSGLDRTTAAISIQNKFTDKLTASGDLNYVLTKGFNRPEVGYGDNSVIQKFFQWGQRQLDMDKLKDYKLSDGSQRSWNRISWSDGRPNFSDNPYWTVNENYSDDVRNRYYGNVKLQYEFTKGLYAVGSVYGDTYSFDIQERVAVGSAAQSSYGLTKRNYTEMNYEGRLHYDKNFGEFSLNAFAGLNRRDAKWGVFQGLSNGGLVVPNLYTLANSSEDPSIIDNKFKKRVNSVFGSVSLGFKNLVFLEATGRNDWSSTLPIDNNSYFYPSVSGSFVFSELFPDNNILNFGKVRGGWAQVRNDTDPYLLVNTYGKPLVTNGGQTMSGFNGTPVFANSTTQKNANLKPELVTTWEIGLEASMFKKRLMFDVTYYNKLTEDLILPTLQTSASTGFPFMSMNSGSMENKGVEALVTIIPVRSEDFEWALTWNFAKNDNIVTELFGDTQFVTLANAPFNASIAAVLGEEWGQIRGTDFVYDENGNKVVGANGLYVETNQPQNLGSVLPDYNMGFRNTFTYRNLSLSALLDIQKGGKYFSTSNMWGHYTGILEETAANGVRENGIVSEGVTGDVAFNADGTYTVTNTAPNTQVVDAYDYYKRYYSGPDAQNVFDADYIKLREVTLTYTFPEKFTGPFAGVQLSVFGRNLATWGLDNEDFDPEMAATGSGNIQGLEGGNLPPSRTIGMNLRLQF